MKLREDSNWVVVLKKLAAGSARNQILVTTLVWTCLRKPSLDISNCVAKSHKIVFCTI